MYKNLRGAFTSAARHPFRATTKLANKFACAALCLFAASHITSSLMIIAGTENVSQNIQDYANDHNLPPSIFQVSEGNKNIRVYNNGIGAHFHLAGRRADIASRNLIKVLRSKGFDFSPDSKAGLLTMAALHIAAYPYEAFAVAKDYLAPNPYDAHIFARKNEEETCIIRPPYRYNVQELLVYATGIHPDDLRGFNIPDNIVHTFIMGHEMAHCEQRPEHDPSLPSESNELESQADLKILEKLEQKYPEYDLSSLIMYMRSVSTFSDPARLNINHASALILDAWKRGDEIPSREDVFHANNQLTEMVRSRLKLYDVQGIDEPRYITVYRSMIDILVEDKTYRSPLVKRAIQLYIEGAHYLVPTVFGPMPRFKQQHHNPVEKPVLGNV